MNDADGTTHFVGDRCSRDLRVLAVKLAAAGFGTDLVECGRNGERAALSVTNPRNRACAEVHASDGELELRCWGRLDDQGAHSLTARLTRLLITSPADDPSATPDDEQVAGNSAGAGARPGERLRRWWPRPRRSSRPAG